MDFLAILAALAALALPVAVIYLLFAVSGLKKRLSNAERQLAQFVHFGAPERPGAAQDGPSTQNASARAADPVASGDLGEKDVPDTTPETVSGSDVPPGAAQPSAAPPAPRPRRVVFTAQRSHALYAWLKENWFYAVSAVSLALAGIFLVQYGMEQGILPPAARVGVALGFGALLVAIGEYLRRRFGDGQDSAVAYLPQVFAGAGIVTLFGAILSARLLYGLIGVEGAFGGLVAIAALSVLLGWINGPLLAAVGITGAMVAPMLVGGSADSADWLYAYWLLVALAGLAVDTMRRWAWVSVLASALGFGMSWLLFTMGGSGLGLALGSGAMVLGAVLIPTRRAFPDHDGPSTIESLVFGKSAGPAGFPANLAAGAVLAGTFLSLLVATTYGDGYWPGICVMAVLAVLLTWWSGDAPGLEFLGLLPATGILLAAFGTHNLGEVFAPALLGTQEAAVDRPWVWGATLMVAIGAILGFAAAGRSLAVPRFGRVWAATAAAYPGLVIAVLYVRWAPEAVLGDTGWALHVIAAAALATLLAERFAKADQVPGFRTGVAALAALSLISLSAGILLSDVALTLALVVAVVGAAWLDRRLGLPQLEPFMHVAIAVIAFRLVAWPGFDWMFDAPYPELIGVFAATVAGLLGAQYLLRTRHRPRVDGALETGAWSLGAVGATVLLMRVFEDITGNVELFWGAALLGLIWFILGTAQHSRAQNGAYLRLLRRILGWIYWATALVLWGVVLVANPIVLTQWVDGPIVFNTLAIAYLLPALAMAGATRTPAAGLRWHRIALWWGAAIMGAAWVGLSIRHFWRGGDLSVPGTTQPELYTYTVALIVVGGILLYRAIATGSVVMRRASMGVIALAVLKVFFVDISNLSGLTRVFSLLALGLALAGLAWLNRWAASRTIPPAQTPQEGSDQIGG